MESGGESSTYRTQLADSEHIEPHKILGNQFYLEVLESLDDISFGIETDQRDSETRSDLSLMNYASRAFHQSFRAIKSEAGLGKTRAHCKIVLVKEFWKSACQLFNLRRVVLDVDSLEESDIYNLMHDSKPEYPLMSLAYRLAQEVMDDFKDDAIWSVLVSQVDEKYIRLKELLEDERFLLERLEDFVDGRKISKDYAATTLMMNAIRRIIKVSEGDWSNQEIFGSEGYGGRNWEDDAELTTMILHRYCRQTQEIKARISPKIVEYGKAIISMTTSLMSADCASVSDNSSNASQRTSDILKVIDEYKFDLLKSKKDIDYQVLDSCKRFIDIAAEKRWNSKKVWELPPLSTIIPSKDLSEVIASTIDLYGMSLGESLDDTDEEVLEAIEGLVIKEREANAAEAYRRHALEKCESDLEEAKQKLLEQLDSYLSIFTSHNKGVAAGPSLEWKTMDPRLLSVLETLLEQAKGKVGVGLDEDHSLKWENNRNWGYAGYTAVLARNYCQVAKETGAEIDNVITDVAQDMIELNNESLTQFLELGTSTPDIAGKKSSRNMLEISEIESNIITEGDFVGSRDEPDDETPDGIIAQSLTDNYIGQMDNNGNKEYSEDTAETRVDGEESHKK